jgi:protein-tyrosine kinase
MNNPSKPLEKNSGGRPSLSVVAPGTNYVALDPAQLDAQSIVGHNDRDARSRPFNLLRTRVVRAAREKGWKLIGVTSAAPGAGKSFVTLNLGASIAQMQDVSVAVVDFDLRRPSLLHKLGIATERGIEAVLDGSASHIDDVGINVEGLNFKLFPALRTLSATSELLTGEQFSRAIAALRALPDDMIVLCDLPPTFANDDSMMILQQLDAYLFVVDEGTTTSTQLNDALALLSGSPCLGTVLNRFTATGDGGYGVGGQYDQYYQD